MKQFTVEEVFKALQRECIPAPLTSPKIIRALKYDEAIMHAALNMYAEGRLTEYHMLPGNGYYEF